MNNAIMIGKFPISKSNEEKSGLAIKQVGIQWEEALELQSEINKEKKYWLHFVKSEE